MSSREDHIMFIMYSLIKTAAVNFVFLLSPIPVNDHCPPAQNIKWTVKGTFTFMIIVCFLKESRESQNHKSLLEDKLLIQN